MRRFLLLTLFVNFLTVIYAQTVITDTAGYTSADGSAVLDVRSTTKGLLLPRLTATQRAGISSPANGLIVYQSSGTTGLYLRNNGSWEKLGTYSLPSLTSGSVLFSDGTTIAEDNTNFIWDNTNKRLGIGVSPNYRVHAILSSSGTNNWLAYFKVSGGTSENRAVTGYAHGTATNYGLFGQAGHSSEGFGTNNYGTYGFAYGDGTTNENFGVYGNTTATGTYNFGVNGKSTGAASGAKYNYGVNGYAGGATGTNSYNVGVFGESVGTGTYNIGVSGRAQVTNNTNYGVWGGAYGGGTSTNYGVRAYSYGGSVGYGTYSQADNATTNYGIYSTASGGTTNYSFYGAAGTLYNAGTINSNTAVQEKGVDVARWRGALSSAPGTDVQEGDIYFNTTDSKVYIYANSSWVALN